VCSLRSIPTPASNTREKEDRLNAVFCCNRQIETIEDRTSRMDAGTSFALVVIQTELERFKFLVRSFLRARIAKVPDS